ncbi:MAG TPA: hypothetical protein VI029_06595 [Mycobacterium sp.]
MTVTSRAQLDPCAAFFATGDTEKLVYYPTDAVAEARRRGVGHRLAVDF